ncbi:MAG: MarC family protein [Alphaproteobacteria bacterium]|nr:MarC family protein [Alphaproteobacteria bacterium]
MFSQFNLQQFTGAFIVLFAVIDVIGSVPIIINLQKHGKKVNAEKVTLYSFIMFMGFFYIGEFFLNLFKLDLSSFAIAGSLIIFIMAMEMILDIEIFREGPDTPKDATFVPLVFPLIAGAGALTTLLSIRAQYADINVILSILANVAVIYITVKAAKFIERKVGAGGIYFLKKCFGIILLAISVKLFLTNLTVLIQQISGKL